MRSRSSNCWALPNLSRPHLSHRLSSMMGKPTAMDSPIHHSRSKAHRKLKESCNECGHAKVKCSKEKPQCSRCRERGLSCGYDFSSRAGRRLAASRSSTSDSLPTSTPRMGNTSQPQQHYFRKQCLTASPSLSPTIMAHNLPLMPESEADMAAFGYFSDTLSMSDYSVDYMTPSASPSLSCAMGMPIDPVMDFSHLSEQDTNNLLSSTGYFHSPPPPVHPIFTPSQMMSPDVMPPSPPRPDTPSTRLGAAGSPVCHEALRGNSSCLSKMLNVLAIQERGQQVEESGYGSEASTPSHHLTSVDDAIHANKTILDAASSTLDCHCLCTSSQLIYLLVSTAFDVMSRYAKAAACPDLMLPSPSLQAFVMANGTGAYPTTDVVPARLVFGELHKVLRFIDVLAQRFSELNALHRPEVARHDSFLSGTSNVSMSSIGNISSSYKPHEMADAWKGQVVCVSESTFRSLEGDLRRRLKEIRDGILAQMRSRTL